MCVAMSIKRIKRVQIPSRIRYLSKTPIPSGETRPKFTRTHAKGSKGQKAKKKKKRRRKKKLVKTKIWATALPSRSRAPRTSAYVDSASRQRPAPPLACDQMSHPFTDGRKRNRAITGNDNDQRRQMSHPYLFGRPATDTVSPIA